MDDYHDLVLKDQSSEDSDEELNKSNAAMKRQQELFDDVGMSPSRKTAQNLDFTSAMILKEVKKNFKN